jgi:hypothetical protein
MEVQAAQAVREDFLVWSGGFPPESDEQIWVYVEAARPADTDPEQVTRLLKDWMAEEASFEHGRPT